MPRYTEKRTGTRPVPCFARSDAVHEVGGLDSDCLGDLGDHPHTRIVDAGLNAAVVGLADARRKSDLLLRHTGRLTSDAQIGGEGGERVQPAEPFATG